MILANMKNLIDNSTSILYFDKNKKSLNAIKINADGKVTEDKDIINQILNIIKYNDNCVFIKKENGYDVYIDQITNYKHYLKDGKEDFLMFYLNNGIDATCYKLKGNKKEKNNKLLNLTKAFFIDFLIINISFVTFGIGYMAINDIKPEEFFCVIEDDSKYCLSLLINKDLNDSKIDAIEANELIKNSNYLDREVKDYLVNEQLFNDIMPYIEDKYIGYMLSNKLKYLKLVEIESFESKDNEDCQTIGYYNKLNPYNIYVDLKDGRESTISHEFIHFLQDSNYSYLTEACTELMNIEYYDDDYAYEDIYEDGVLNLKLLIQTIGQEPILKSVFSGDSSELLEILKQNLSKEDYEEFLNILRFNPISKEVDNARLQELISILYMNIYDENMYDNPSIMYELENYGVSNIIYFNSALKQNEYEIELNLETAYKLGYIQRKEVYFRKISAKEYIELKDTNWCEVAKGVTPVEIKDNVVSFLYEDKEISLEEAEKHKILYFYEYSLEKNDKFKESNYIYNLFPNDLNGGISQGLYLSCYVGNYIFKVPSYEQKLKENHNQKTLVK